MIRILIFLLLVGSVVPLAQAQQFSVSSYPFKFKGRQLIVGNALGKLEKEYRLLEDGGIYRRMSTDTTFEKLGEQSKKNVEIAFKSLSDVKFQEMNFNNPDRRYKFVKYQKDKAAQAVIWRSPKQPAPPGIEQVYRAFMGMIPPTMQF